MSTITPPNQALADLVAVLGDDNVRTLARTFLRDFPIAFRALESGDRADRNRRAHSMKSNAQLMGAPELSRCLAGLESRLSDDPEMEIPASEFAAISRMFDDIARRLQTFVGD